MLSPSYLDRVSDDVVELYNAFETIVLEDIARRISKMDYLTATAEFQIEQLRQAGFVYENIIMQLSKMTGKSTEEIQATFESAGVKTLSFDDSIYKSNGLSPIPLAENSAMIQMLTANSIKTSNDLLNLTRTTAVHGQQLFIQSTTMAQLQVQSGAFSYNQAIKNAVKMASKEGLKVTYPTGVQRTIESAVRSNVLTGVNQTALQLQDIRADELDSDLVEVTAHAGARNTGTGPENHQAWQGKVYSRSGTSARYGNFKVITGYGTVTGLGGVNCRHSWFPFFPGQDRAYSQELLRSWKQDDVTYNGKTISYYEATQKQRYIERNIRKWKTESKIMDAAGLDPSFANSKVRAWQAKARDLVDQTKVKRDYTRERIV